MGENRLIRRIGCRLRVLGVVFVGILATATLPGCGALPFVSSQSCVDWVAWDTPAQAAAEAAAVVVGDVGPKAGTTDLYGYIVNVWTVDVRHWLKGDDGDSIRVVSPPETCSEGSPYPTGDPLEKASGPSVLLLGRDGGSWQTLTPWQGIVPVGEDGGVPDAWPAGAIGSPPPAQP